MLKALVMTLSEKTTEFGCLLAVVRKHDYFQESPIVHCFGVCPEIRNL